MAAATFDFTNLIIDLPAPTGGFLTMDLQEDIYSDWKVAIKTVDNIAPPAFDVTAGDPLPTGVLTGTYFLRNDLGWRIRSTDEDQEITINGNLYPRDSAITKYLYRAGRTVAYEINLTANPRQVSSGSGLDAGQTTQLLEIWRRLALDASNPLTNKSDGGITATDITIAATPSGDDIVQTRS